MSKDAKKSACCGADIRLVSGLSKCSRCDQLLDQRDWDVGGLFVANSPNAQYVGGMSWSGYRKGIRNTGGLGGQ